MKKFLSGALLSSVLGTALLAAPAAMAQDGTTPQRPERGLTREMAVHAAMERFDRADKNGDGILSRDEMKDAAKHMRDGFGRDEKGPRFEGGPRGDHREEGHPGKMTRPMPRPQPGFDQDAAPDAADGHMRPQTLPFHFEGDQARRSKDMVRSWKKADGDFGEERAARLKAFFDRFDADGDGVISKEEMSSARPPADDEQPTPPAQALAGAPQD